MNPVEAQQEIITEMCQMIHGQTPDGCSKATCSFECEPFDDGSSSVGWAFEYFLGGECVSIGLDMDSVDRFHTLVSELHRLMKAHTGDDWATFTLTPDQDGKANVKFDCPKATP
jgi:hypothetical protein